MDETTEQAPLRSRLDALARRRPVQVAAAILFGIAAGTIVWLVSGSGPSGGGTTGARAVSVADLAALPARLHHPVYWAGPKAGYTYELTATSDGKISLPYLPVGVGGRTNHPRHLTADP